MPKYSSIFASQTDIERVNMVVQSNFTLNDPRGYGFFNWNISTNGYINYPALISLYRDIKDGTFDLNKGTEKYLQLILSNLVEIQKIGSGNTGYSAEWNDLIKQKNYAEIFTKLVAVGILDEPDHLCKHAGLIVLTLIALAKSDKNVVEELTITLNNLPKELDSLSRSIAKLENDYKDTTDKTVIENIKFLKSELRRFTLLSEKLPDAITFLRDHNSTNAVMKLLDDLNKSCRVQFEKDICRGIQIELGGITQKLFLSEADFMVMMRNQLKLSDSEIAFIINGWHQNGIPSHAGPLSFVLASQIDPAGDSYIVKVASEPVKITISEGKLVEISSVNNYEKKDANEPTNPPVMVGTSTVKYTAASNPKGITSFGENRTGSFPDINLEFSYQAKSPEGQLDLSIRLPTAPKAMQAQTETPRRPSAPAASSSNAGRNLLARVIKKHKGQRSPISREPYAPSSQKDNRISGRKENVGSQTTAPTSRTESAKPSTPVRTPQSKPSINPATQAGAYSDPLGLTIRKPAARTVGNPVTPLADTPSQKK
jgi:hypothetical protein